MKNPYKSLLSAVGSAFLVTSCTMTEPVDHYAPQQDTTNEDAVIRVDPAPRSKSPFLTGGQENCPDEDIGTIRCPVHMPTDVPEVD